MPNWCHNIALFRHNDLAMMEKLKHGASTNELLNEFIPRPNDEQIWHEWCVDNWGTKLDADIMKYTLKPDGYYEISFRSAWSPPIPFYETMIKFGFSIKAVYKETGIMFIGQFVEGIHSHFNLDYETYMILPEFILSYYKENIEDEKELPVCHDDLN